MPLTIDPSQMPIFYILGPGHIIVPVTDPVIWAQWFSDHRDARRVGWDEPVPDVFVSTVFLGIDHSFSGGPPLVFETMVESDYGWNDEVRYCTWNEAEAGHRAMVEKVIARQQAATP